MHDDATDQVGHSQASSQLLAVRRVDTIVADQVEGRAVRRQAGEGVEQAVNSLALNPVGHAQQRRLPTLAQVQAHRVLMAGSDVAARWHDLDAGRSNVPAFGQLDRQRLARRQQAPGRAVGELIQRGLHRRSPWPVVDPARWLMEHPDQWPGRSPDGQGWADEGGRDAVEYHHIVCGDGRPHHARAIDRREREGAIGHRVERQAGVVAGRGVGDTAVKQVAAGQPTGVAQGNQRNA